MSQSLKVHSVWLSVSLLSFIIGFKFFPSSSENDTSTFDKNVQSTTIGKNEFVEKSKINLNINKYINVDNKVLWKKGIAITYDCIKPEKFFSYIGKVNQDPKFVII